MAQHHLAPEERETILRTDDASGGWSVYTTRGSRMARKLLKIAGRPGVSVEDAGEHGLWLTLPLNAVRFVAPRALTAAEMEQRRRALAKGKG